MIRSFHKTTLSLMLLLGSMTLFSTEASGSVITTPLEPGDQVSEGADFFTLEVLGHSDETVHFRLTVQRRDFVGVFASLQPESGEISHLEWMNPEGDPAVTEFEVARNALATTELYVTKDLGLVATRYELALDVWFEALAWHHHD